MSEPEISLRDALDHARSYYAKMVKPFEKLAQVLEAAETAERRRVVAEAAIIPLEAQRRDLGARLDVLREEVAAAEQRSREAITRAEQLAATAQDAYAQKTRVLDERMAAATAVYEARVAARDREAAARLAAQEQALVPLRAEFERVTAEHAAFLKKIGAR